jgi:hypothetical protein
VSDALPSLPWCPPLAPPLCDVPWMGNVTVAEDGNVQFCCFSPAIVGNVNQAPFAAIWNGATMRRLRETLGRQEFPPECRTNSCPVFRRDAHHFILERTRGPSPPESRPGPDPRTLRAAFAGTRLVLSSATVRRGEWITVALEIATGPAAPRLVDLVVALLSPAASPRFLPDLGEVPVPLQPDLELPTVSPCTIPIFEGAVPAGLDLGEHELIATLFLSESNPSVVANCLMATRATLRILANDEPTPSRR